MQQTTKVLVWATSLGADLWSLTRYLDGRDDVDMRIVTDRANDYHRQPVGRLFPLRAPIIERHLWHHVVGLPGFRPDVTLMDNRVPWRATSRAGMMIWHGFGWKGPQDRAELDTVHRKVRRAWGSAEEPNPNFVWQCPGVTDFEHRTKVSGIAPENCRVIGAAGHDDMREPLDRTLVAGDYPFEIVGRKTVLIAPTWHYGEVFAHWGRDRELFGRLLARIDELGANAIIRLHDSFRIDPEYRAAMEAMAAAHPRCILKYKDQHPDNFVDMQVSDVLLTNYSAIATMFYATLRPTIHIYPVRSADEAFFLETYEGGKLSRREVGSARFVWKMPPEEHGGLLARDFDELLEQVGRALADPRCCEAQARSFLERHMTPPDGGNCERIFAAMQQLAAGARRR